MAFVCLDFGSTFSWNLVLHLGLDLRSNSTLLVPALNKDMQGYGIMLLTTSWGISFPCGIILPPPFPQELRNVS